MLELVLVAAGGLTAATVYHATDLLNVPLPLVALSWAVFQYLAAACVYKEVLYWGSYSLFVFQLISFHDKNPCLINECSTNTMFAYLTLGCIYLLWVSTDTRVKEKPKMVAPKKLDVKLKFGKPLKARWV